MTQEPNAPQSSDNNPTGNTPHHPPSGPAGPQTPPVGQQPGSQQLGQQPRTYTQPIQPAPQQTPQQGPQSVNPNPPAQWMRPAQNPPQGQKMPAQNPRPSGYEYAPQQNPYASQQNPYGQQRPPVSNPPFRGQPNQPYSAQQPPPQQFNPYQQGSQGGYYAPQGPPPNAPAPKKIKRSPIPMIIGLVIVLVVGTFSLIALVVSLTTGTGSSAPSVGSGMFSFGEKIAVLDVGGVLGAGETYPADTERLKALVDKWTENESIKGMVIRVNSPGGAVSATQDLFYSIEKFRATGRPVYTSMGDIAASGGYYIAMASDKVYVNTGTLTGSVGVVLNFYGYEELFGKLGLESRVIKSGEFKDIGSGTRPITDEERALLNTMITDVFEQFFEVVVDGRMEAVQELLAEQKSIETGTTVAAATITRQEVEAHLRQYCDGRIFSGRQALEYGMADQTGTIDQALEDMRTNLGLQPNSPVVLTPSPTPGLFGFFDKQVNALDRFTPGSVHLEFRFTM